MRKYRTFKIRTKIMLYYTLLSVVLLLILIPTVYGTVAASLTRTMDAKFEKAFLTAVTSIEAEEGNVYIDQDIKLEDGAYLYVADGKGRYRYSYPGREWLPEGVKDTALIPKNEIQTTEEKIDKALFVVKYQKLEMNETTFIVYIGMPKTEMELSLRNLKLSLSAFAPIYLLISAAGAYVLAKRALAPIAEITATAGKIEKGDLTKRIEGKHPNDEVGQLAQTFNRMLDELEVSFNRERQFTSDASHELRTPVAVITACSEDLQSSLKEPEAKKSLNDIQRECGRMNRMINQLLLLSRGYEGRYQSSKEYISLNEIVQGTEEVLTKQASEKRIEFHNHIEPELFIYADQSLMTQLFINLLSNAIKYGKEKGKIIISAHSTDTEVCIDLWDNGIGIEEKELEHIFERFYRADKARNRSGNGLGLAIVKWILDIHCGRIEAKSQIGEWTEFSIRLPKGEEKNA